MKKVLCLFLACLILVLMSILIPYQQADAMAEAAALLLLGEGATVGATVLTIATGVGLLLIAAGVTYLAVTELNKAIDDYYNSRSDAQKAEIANSINADGTMTVPDSLWNDVRSYVSTKYNINEIPATVTSYKVFTVPGTGETYPYTAFPSSMTVSTLKLEMIKGSSVILQGHKYTIVQTYSGTQNGTAWDKYKVQVDGHDIITDDPTVIFSNTIDGVIKTFATRNDMAFERTCTLNSPPFFYFAESATDNPNGEIDFRICWDLYNYGGTATTYNVLRRTDNKYIYPIAKGLNTTGTKTVSYKAQPQLTDSTWDWKNTTTGKRTVTLPTTYDKLVGKTATEIKANTVAAPATITPYSNSWTGKFSDCATGDYVFTGTGAGSIGVTNTGDWAGTWSIPTTGAKTWTGTYTGADGISIDVTATEVVTPSDTGTEFDYPELKVPADILKNKFPFSIPWDLKNAVSSLLATPQAPKWVITFPSNYFIGGGQIVIDFSQFEVWAKIIRWGVLICFNIFLILATRKIIGAS